MATRGSGVHTSVEKYGGGGPGGHPENFSFKHFLQNINGFRQNQFTRTFRTRTTL